MCENKHIDSDRLIDDNTNSSDCQEGRKKIVKRRISYNAIIRLYPEDASTASVLAKIVSKYDYTYILHDRDTWTEDELDCLEDTLGEVEESQRFVGGLKKPHYHIIVHFPKQKDLDAVANEFKIPNRFVRLCSDRDAQLRYLIHLGFHDKFQYPLSDVVTNRPSLINEAVQKYSTFTEKMDKLIYIIQNKNCISIRFGIQMALRYGLGKFATDNYPLFRDLIDEQRTDYYRQHPQWMNKFNPPLEKVELSEGVTFDNLI